MQSANSLEGTYCVYVVGDTLCVRFGDMHIFCKLRKRKTGDWLAAKKLQVGEEKRMVRLIETEKTLYRVIHKSLRDFRNRLHNNQDRHGIKEHINR